MDKLFLRWAGIFGLLTIILGAFGAHSLKEVLTEQQIGSFQTGIRYQAWHAIALLVLSLSPTNLLFKKWILWCWVLGVILFSFSIYLLSTTEVSGVNFSWLGPFTPLGGLFLMMGWLLLLISSFSKEKLTK